MKFKPLPGKVFVEKMKKGERTVGGIVLINDDGKTEGIRPRWGRVYAIGDDVGGIEVGDWVLVQHGRWSRKITLQNDEGKNFDIWQVEHPKSTLCVSDEEPNDEYINWSLNDGQKSL